MGSVVRKSTHHHCVAMMSLSEVYRNKYCDEFDFDRRDAELAELASARREEVREAEVKSLAAAQTIAHHNPLFLMKVSELELSVRASRSLTNEGIVYVGDLVKRTEAELLRTPYFGRKSLNEIKEALVLLGLHLGFVHLE